MRYPKENWGKFLSKMTSFFRQVYWSCALWLNITCFDFSPRQKEVWKQVDSCWFYSQVERRVYTNVCHILFEKSLFLVVNAIPKVCTFFQLKLIPCMLKIRQLVLISVLLWKCTEDVKRSKNLHSLVNSSMGVKSILGS